MTDDITIEVPSPDDWDAIFLASRLGFNQEPDEAVGAVKRKTFEPERALVARRDGEIVGTAGIYTRQLSVPGGPIPAGHVTLVTVLPTATRRGVLTRFMRQQFADIRAAGESIAVLWASEGRIYQRFGYGLAARRLSLAVDTREVRVDDRFPSVGRLREAPPTALVEAMTKVYDEAYAQRPGWSERTARNWDVSDPPAWRSGASPLRAVVHESDHGVDGYAMWRVRGHWDDGGPAGTVNVVEVATTTVEAYAAIWRFLLTLDLTRTTHHWTCSVDEPLQFMVNEPRRLGGTFGDALWVRIVDLPAALSARRYASEVDVVFEVSDASVPENAGRWRLTGSPTAAQCVSTVDQPDMACDILALGAAYLGGTPLGALADAGLVRELRPGAVAEASPAFGWYRTPSSIEIF